MKALFLTFAVALCGVACGAEELRPALPRIDAHVHVFQPSAAYVRMLERLDLRVMNICVVDKHDRGFEEAEPQHKVADKISRQSRGRIAWCSTFDPGGFERPDFAQRSIAQLEDTFTKGAIAVKIYKSMGMELKTAAGKYVMPDDPAFAAPAPWVQAQPSAV